jgi:energy-coupling factor transport system ATP-binding protein
MASTATSDLAVDLRGLTFTYDRGEKPALIDVSLSLRRGELVVLMGRTGAGKSTLAKCINRTVPAFQTGTLRGGVSVLGRDLDGVQVGDLAGEVGLVLQDFEAQLFSTDVVQEIAFGLEQLGLSHAEMDERVRASLALVGLTGFEHRDPATLSGGEKQRLAIAAVLAMRPPVLVFDEPTTDLDPLGKRDVFRVLEAMRREGHTMLLIEHEIDAAEAADRIVLLDEGRIVADAPARQVRRDIALLQRAGVRPSDVDRIVVAMKLPEEVQNLDDLEAALRSRPLHAEARAAAAAVAPTAAPFLEVRGADFDYPDGKSVLRGIDLSLHEGEFVALIGQNGSGKTTLAKMLNGLLTPARGQVLLGGQDLSKLALTHVASQIGYVFQDPDQQLFAASVRDEVSFGPRNLRVPAEEMKERVAEALAAVGLEGLEDGDPFLLGKGQRQRLAVAALLAQRPRLLILDEPTTGLDFSEQVRMMELVASLHRRGLIVVVITHSPWVVAQYAGRGVLLAGGRVVFDGPLRALFREEELLETSHFRVPAVTRLGRRLGRSVLSVEEFLGAGES